MEKKQYASEQTPEKTVLIVDDDRDIGETLRSIIHDQTPYRTLWIAESDLALEAASHLKPSLILLDYMLPVLDGLQLFDYLQGLEHMRKVPVVVISAYPSLSLRRELRERGVRFLPKPFDFDELVELVKQLVEAGERVS